jgi:hypothetical protein
MGTRQMTGGAKEAPMALMYGAEEVEESTISRRIHTAENPIEKASTQKRGNRNRESREPNKRKQNHKRRENRERAEQRLRL